MKNELDDNAIERKLQSTNSIGGGLVVWFNWSTAYNDENDNEKNCLLSTYYVHALFLIYKPYKIGIIIPFTDEKIFIFEKLGNLPTVT